MQRKACLAAFLTFLVVVTLGLTGAPTGPIRLARHPDLSRRADCLQLSRRHLGRQRGRHERPADHRQLGARGVSALLAGRPLDRVLVEPLRQLRRVRRPHHGRDAAPADLPYRHRRRRRMDAGFAAGDLPRGARRRRVPERRRPLSNRRRRRTGEAAAGRLGLLRRLFAGRQIARLQPPPFVLVAEALPRQLRRRSLDSEHRRQDLHEAAGRRTIQPLLADVGSRRRDLFRRPIRCPTTRAWRPAPGRPEERQQHL